MRWCRPLSHRYIGEDLTTETVTEAESVAPADEESQENGRLLELDIETLYKAKVHLGHLTKRWHPRMNQYVMMNHQRRHILDMSRTLVAIDDAKQAVREIAAGGGECLFVGTKPQAQKEIQAVAARTSALYITSRWLGGTLTNFATITRRLETLVELEEQFTKGEVNAKTKKELMIKQAEVNRLNKFFGGDQRDDQVTRRPVRRRYGQRAACHKGSDRSQHTCGRDSGFELRPDNCHVSDTG